eukprot:IDg741t1
MALLLPGVSPCGDGRHRWMDASVPFQQPGTPGGLPRTCGARRRSLVAADVGAPLPLEIRKIPVVHEDGDGLPADDIHPLAFREFLQGSERDVRRMRRNAIRRGSRARSPSVSEVVATGRKRKGRGSRRLV